MDAEELLKRIRELEEGQAELKREVSDLVTATERRAKQQPAAAVPTASRRELRRDVSKHQLLLPPPERRGAPSSSSRRRLPPPPPPVGRTGLSRRHHAMVLQSLGQAVHILDLQGNVIYWNRCAEHLYGYPASEAIGRNDTDLLVHADDIGPSTNIIGSIFAGKCWRGKFPVKNKSGERFSILTNGTPLYDDDGTMHDRPRLSLR